MAVSNVTMQIMMKFMVSNSGLKVGHTCWPIDPQKNPDMTHIAMTHLWSTCWSFLFKCSQCNMTWKIFDMEQCHRFLHSWQDTEPVPCTDFLKMKSLDTTCFKLLEIKIIWFHTNDISVHSSDPKFAHLPDANTVF